MKKSGTPVFNLSVVEVCVLNKCVIYILHISIVAELIAKVPFMLFFVYMLCNRLSIAGDKAYTSLINSWGRARGRKIEIATNAKDAT